MKKIRHGGFTLIELMIVVAIVGILASVSLPAYQDYTAKAQAAEIFLIFDSGKKGVAEYYARWGSLPSNNTSAGLYPPSAYRGRYVDSMEVKDGSIRVSLRGGADAPLNRLLKGTAAYFRPQVVENGGVGMLEWACRGGDKDLTKAFSRTDSPSLPPVPNELLPRACRK